MHAGRKCTPGPVACPVGDRGFWGCRRLGLCCPASGRPSREVARAAGPGEAPEREMAAGRGRGYGRNQREQQPIPARGPTRSPPPRACAFRGARSRAPAPRAGDTKGWRESAERGRRSGPGSASFAAQPGGSLGPFPAPRLQRLQRPRRPRASIFPRSSISTQPSSCCIPVHGSCGLRIPEWKRFLCKSAVCNSLPIAVRISVKRGGRAPCQISPFFPVNRPK